MALNRFFLKRFNINIQQFVIKGALWLLKFVGCKFIFDLGLLGRGLILSTTLSIIMAELSSRRCRRSILNSSEKKEEK